MKFFAAAYLLATLLVALPVLSAPVPVGDGDLLVKRTPGPKKPKNSGSGNKFNVNVGLNVPIGQSHEQHHDKRSFDPIGDGELLAKRTPEPKKSKKSGNSFHLNVGVPAEQQQKRSFEEVLERRDDELLAKRTPEPKKSKKSGNSFHLNVGVPAEQQQKRSYSREADVLEKRFFKAIAKGLGKVASFVL